MKIFRKRSTVYFAALWILSIGLLRHDVVSRSFLSKDATVDINDGALIMRQDYLGYYLGGKKIGYSHFVLKEDSDEIQTKLPGKYYVFKSETELRVRALGISFDIKIRHIGEVNEDLSLRSFRFDFDAGGQKIYAMGNIESDGLHLITKSDGTSSEQTFPLQTTLYHTEMVHLLVARDGMKIGESKAYAVYDPMTMAFGSVTAKIMDKENVELEDGKTVEAYKVEVNFKGLRSTSWIGDEGELVKDQSQISGIEFIAVRETKEQALNMDYQHESVDLPQGSQEIPDLISASRILTATRIEHPDKVTEMLVKLTGAESGDLIFDGTFQTLADSPDDALLIRTTKQDYRKAAASLPEQNPPYALDHPDLKPFLDEQPLIQSNDPAIRQKALEIAGKAKNALEASITIAEWLYRNVKKEMRPTIPSAAEVLNAMKGDCNEHSTLLAALARSIGIPAKICAGIVYQNDGFYYHAWNEIYAGGAWLPIDSTLNRIEMDAAHIKFAEGSLDSQANLIKLIGNLKLEIVAYKEQ
ncbi:MAG: transglutaminase-like domain-containing protein [Candidatus Omnitrophota bacterium]